MNLKNIFFIIGLISVVVMCFTFEVSFIDLWEYITTAGYWLVAILMLWLFLYMLNALSWRIILRGSGPVNVSYGKLLKWTISAFALNTVTPVGLAGGEPYKILELKPYVGVQRATSSVVLFAMMYIFAHFTFWAVAIVTYIALWIFGQMPMDALTAALLFLMSLFCGAGIYLFCRGYKNGMVVKFIRLLCHIPGLKKWAARYASDHADDLKKIDEQISALHRQNRKSFWLTYALEFFGRMMQSFELVFIIFICSPALSSFFCDHMSLITTFINSFLILAFTSLFANLLFFLPLQLGGREGGFAMSTSQIGMTDEMGLYISIICRVRELFWTVAGLLLMKIGTENLYNRPASTKLK